MCNDDWDGQTERRTGFCPVHHMKCDEWKSTEEKVNLLERTKVSFVVLKILLTIILSIGGSYWYYQDTVVRSKFTMLMQAQTESTNALKEHVKISNIILRDMSRDVRESKLNLKHITKELDVEYHTIPEYYGPKDK
jgi:hypothetical protein